MFDTFEVLVYRLMLVWLIGAYHHVPSSSLPVRPELIDRSLQKPSWLERGVTLESITPCCSPTELQSPLILSSLSCFPFHEEIFCPCALAMIFLGFLHCLTFLSLNRAG